ncbi:MAG TPA: D-alanyl-D-alanine carboxypeptidase [Erysipelotrichaceae bacterium]|nr:D-alanyl-D-alanine carboxypeptidase [Erysipelotrichaceae bacterium]
MFIHYGRIIHMTENRTKKRIGTTGVIQILLAISLVFLGISVYAFYHPQKITPASPEPSEEASAQPTPEVTPLPSHLTDPNSIYVFIDKTHPVAEDFVPSDLAAPYFNSTGEIIQLKQEAADHLKAMMNAAAAENIQLVVFAGYISYQTQSDYYQDRVSLLGEAEASKVIEKPGYSEHQCGIAVDFSSNSTSATSVSYAETDAGKWLYAHAHEYGYILRYPKDKESLTGYSYMPWHYRYIGEEYAKMMYEISPDLTLEEFYAINK